MKLLLLMGSQAALRSDVSAALCRMGLESFARSIVHVHACSLAICGDFICIRGGVTHVGAAVGKIAVSPPAPTQTPTLRLRLMYGNGDEEEGGVALGRGGVRGGDGVKDFPATHRVQRSKP